MYQFVASIVMSVYNAELFLRESIDSVIKQDAGFENIQLILVDDGSTDGSGAICDEYGALYPDNVQVIHKENGGVSSARNEGLKYVQGKYVNFMDSDDKLSSNVVRVVCEFLNQHGEETDVVAFPMRFFDGRRGEHTLNYKFDRGNRVINLDKEWQNPQLSMSSAFVKSECIVSLGFDTRLAYCEDAQVMQKILSNKVTLGVVKNATYWYRRRSSGEQSAVQSAVMRSERYLPCMQYFHQELIDYFLEKFRCVPRFIQFLLMYDLQWRINQAEIPDGVLSQEDRDAYFSSIKRILTYIDDDVIMAQRNIYSEHKFFALSFKYEGALFPIARDNDMVFMSPGGATFKVSEFPAVLEFLTPTDDGIDLEGSVSCFVYPRENIDILVRTNGEYIRCITNILPVKVVALEREILYKIGFKAHISVDTSGVDCAEVILGIGKLKIPLRRVSYGLFFPITSVYRNSYIHVGKWIVGRVPGGIRIRSEKSVDIVELEHQLCKELWEKNDKGGRHAVFARYLSKVMRKLKRRPIWLISDRASRAGDNGEAMFRYMRKNHPEIDCYFVLNSDCSDYKRMKKIGPVLAKDSHLHKMLLLISDFNISSQVGVDINNPFYKYKAPYCGMIAPNRYIFLQHGITQNDVSSLLQRRKANLAGIITAANPEWKSIVYGNYDYTEKQVWLTGFPRFDRLYNNDQKVIAIVPTWRRFLMGKLDKHTGIWSLAPGFTSSSFFRFYNGLINNAKLTEVLKRHGYTLAFFPHPNLQPYINLFATNPQVEFLGSDTEYRDLYAKCSLMLTDYSSAVFDFAYLRKPVIYCHMDRDDFFSGRHTLQKGYFDHERDGFGEVEYTLEATVDRITEYVENGCQLKQKYRERIDNFFAFNDQNNCQRVYEKIIELSQKL